MDDLKKIGVSFLDALKGAAEKQHALEAKYGKPPAGHPTGADLDAAMGELHRLLTSEEDDNG